MNINKNLCLMPWLHMATLSSGDVKLCCIAKNNSKLNLNNESIVEIWNSEYYKNTRKSMLAGERISTCDTCWKEEDLGIKSHRNIANQIYIKKAGIENIQQVLSSTKDDGSLEITPPTLDLRLGNVCNLECIMCHPNDSSKWVKRAFHLAENLETEIKFQWKYKSAINTSNYDWFKEDSFWNSFKSIAPNLMHITFGGGEPLYVKEHKKIIKFLVDHGYSKKIEMLYHTNGTIYDPEIVELWKKFSSIKIMLSIDGYGEVNDYIRRPSVWKEIENNLRHYDNTKDNIIVSINTTVQIANIQRLTEFASWLLAQNFKKVGKSSDGGIFFASLLHYPPYLSIQALPQVMKKEITDQIKDFVNQNKNNQGIARLNEIVDFMNAEDKSNLLAQTIDYLKTNDSKDGVSSKLIEDIKNKI